MSMRLHKLLKSPSSSICRGIEQVVDTNDGILSYNYRYFYIYSVPLSFLTHSYANQANPINDKVPLKNQHGKHLTRIHLFGRSIDHR